MCMRHHRSVFRFEFAPKSKYSPAGYRSFQIESGSQVIPTHHSSAAFVRRSGRHFCRHHRAPRAWRALDHQATHDSMTQLLDRTSMNERLELLLASGPATADRRGLPRHGRVTSGSTTASAIPSGTSALQEVAGRLEGRRCTTTSSVGSAATSSSSCAQGVDALDDAHALAEESMAVLPQTVQIGEHGFQVTAAVRRHRQQRRRLGDLVADAGCR